MKEGKKEGLQYKLIGIKIAQQQVFSNQGHSSDSDD